VANFSENQINESMEISINGIKISEEAVNLEMQYHPADSRNKAWLRAAQSLAVKELLRQQAIEQGLLSASDNVDSVAEETAVDALLKQEIEVPVADTETCRRYYDAHPKAFVDKETKERLAFDEAEEWVRHYLHTGGMRAAISEYIKALVAESDVKGIQLINNEIPMGRG
jgi:hypothetical protein